MCACAIFHIVALFKWTSNVIIFIVRCFGFDFYCSLVVSYDVNGSLQWSWLLEFNPPNGKIFRHYSTCFHCIMLPTLLGHACGNTHTCLYVYIWIIPFNGSLVEKLECMPGFVWSETVFWHLSTEISHIVGLLLLAPAAFTVFLLAKHSCWRLKKTHAHISAILGKSMVI